MLQTKAPALSTGDRIMAGFLAAFSTFVLGYTLTRVYLGESQSVAAQEQDSILPHQAELWRVFAE